MPRIRSKQILGETPTRPEHLTTKEFVENLISASGGTGGSSISIEDEYNPIISGVTVINFIGADVKTESAISGTVRRVNVYVPPPQYASHFNTSDGTTNASVTPYSTTSRYIALPTTEGNPYKVGSWSGGEIHNTIRNSVNNLTYSTTGNFSIFNNTSTTFTVVVQDANGTSSLSTHSLVITGNDIQTQNNITITVTNFTQDADKYKADISISINISSILPQGGRFNVRMTHNNSTDGIFTFTQNNIFRDRETLSAAMNGPLTITPSITPTIKQISGVYFYTTGTNWEVDLPDIDNINSRTYPTTQQLRITETNLYISENLNVHGEGGSYDEFVVGTWSRQHDTANAQYNKTDWTTDETNQTNWNHSTGDIEPTYATAELFDWNSIGTVNSNNYNYLIDTLSDISDRNSEMFRTENDPNYPRLQSDLTTPWDSNSPLLNVSTDGGNGLQILGDRLVYPQYNFTSYQPNTGSQPNYTSSSGDKVYYRLFETNGGANVSNGVIRLSDHNITETDLTTDNIIFEITVDNGTSWFIVNDDYIGGILTDGSGCRVDPSEYGLGTGSVDNNAIKFTLGQGGSSTFVHLKITYSSTATDKYIGGVDFIEGNWV